MKPIPGHSKYLMTTDGRVYSTISGKYLRPRMCGSGYLRIGITERKKKKQYHYFIHSLILKTFVGPRPKGHFAAHLSGNPLDNRLENLKWVTPKENTSHMIAHGTRSPWCKLLPRDARKVRREYRILKKPRGSIRDNRRFLATKFKVSAQTIMRIVNQKRTVD